MTTITTRRDTFEAERKAAYEAASDIANILSEDFYDDQHVGRRSAERMTRIKAELDDLYDRVAAVAEDVSGEDGWNEQEGADLIPLVLPGTRPECQLSGTDGNVFGIIGEVAKTLRKAGHRAEAAEFAEKALESESYAAVLSLASEYVEVS